MFKFTVYTHVDKERRSLIVVVILIIILNIAEDDEERERRCLLEADDAYVRPRPVQVRHRPETRKSEVVKAID